MEAVAVGAVKVVPTSPSSEDLSTLKLIEGLVTEGL
jgi:hypothetical protein